MTNDECLAALSEEKLERQILEKQVNALAFANLEQAGIIARKNKEIETLKQHYGNQNR